MLNSHLSFRPLQANDFKAVCQLPLNEQKLFFMYPKAKYPLSIGQLQSITESRADSTVILLHNAIVDFANFYEVKENE